MSGGRLRLLGEARLRSGGRAIDFEPDMRFQALVWLAYGESWLPRERLAYLFWPDRRSRVARQNLRQLLRRIGRLTWLEGFGLKRDRVRWQVRTDVSAFRKAYHDERFMDAIRLYGGPLAPGMGSDRLEFGSWLAAERLRLHECWREAVFAGAEMLDSAGDALRAASLLGRLLDVDALDEDAVRGRMRLLARAGRLGEARRIHRRFANHLQVELGMSPALATERLASELRDMTSDAVQAQDAPDTSLEHRARRLR